MSAEESSLAERVERLESRVAELSLKLESLGLSTESHTVDSIASEAAPQAAPTDASTASPDVSLAGLLGRSCLVLGGAYLLRALATTGSIPPSWAAGIGLVYAFFWFALSERDGRHGLRTSALFHAASALIVGSPLVFEGAARLALFSAPWAAVLLALVAGTGFLLAVRHDLRPIAGLVVVSGLLGGIGLAIQSRQILPYSLALVALDAAALAAVRRRRWAEIAWGPALVLDAYFGAIGFAASSAHAPDWLSSGLVVPPLLAFTAVHLIAFGLRLLRTEEARVGPFMVIQSLAAWLLGFETAARLLPSPTPPGLFSLALSLAAAAAAVAIVRRPGGAEQPRLAWFAALAALAGAEAIRLLAGPGAAPVGWALLAIVAAWLAASRHRNVFAPLSTIFAIGAALAAGFAQIAAAAFIGGKDLLGSAGGVVPLTGVLIATILAHRTIVRSDPADPPIFPSIAVRLVLLALLAAECGAIFLATTLRALDSTNPGVPAALRTAVLAGAAIVLTFSARRLDWREAGWLGIGALWIGGVKLVFEDLRTSSPTFIVASLGSFGIALILVPRLGRKRSISSAGSNGDPSSARVDRPR